MEPRIQYAKTEDGVSIAFYTLGEGLPLVYPGAVPFTHLELEWQNPAVRAFNEHIAQKRKLVRFDPRGLGMSARAYHRVLRLGRTIADLAGSAKVSAQHVGEAIQYRRFAGN